MTTLILIPTQTEMEIIRPLLTDRIDGDKVSFQLCGFGPIAAAGRCGALISRYSPQRVMLVGIAGSYAPDRLQIATAHRFDSVACDGVGVGMGASRQSAAALGWHQFAGDGTEPTIGDILALNSSFVDGIPSAGQLLTCCSASGDRHQVDDRRARFPAAVAEDMEGFGVALACTLARIPLQIVRGISNHAGDRDHQHWSIDQALIAAAEMSVALMRRPWMPAPL